jgi:hypothetical protein
MKANERRYTPRFKLNIPLRARSVSIPESLPQSVECFDISERGLYFSTDLPLHVGSPVQMFFRMPEEVAGKLSPEWCCTCRVVRVDPSVPLSAVFGVGVEIQYYEVMKA